MVDQALQFWATVRPEMLSLRDEAAYLRDEVDHLKQQISSLANEQLEVLNGYR